MHIVERLIHDEDALKSAGVTASEIQDDGTDWLGKIVEKPWGFESEIYHSEQISIWCLVINPGAETSMHAHPNKLTMLAVEKGECVLETLHRSIPLKAGEWAVIKPGAFHRTRTETGAEVLEMETPRNKRDLVRIKDRYGRVGKGYERV